MQAEQVEPSTLTSDRANARRHDRRNLEAIKASLERFGQQKPIVVDAEGLVLAGNGTLQAVRELGWTSVSVVRTRLRGAEARAYAVADNRASDLAGWDEQELARTLAALQNDASIDESATGFDEGEIEAIIAAACGLEEPEADPPSLASLHQVVVDCDDETEQRRIFERLSEEGRRCRLLTL